jgi:DNA-binding CsgD family transcriptional regulator
MLPIQDEQVVDELFDAVGSEDRFTAALARFIPAFDASAVLFLSMPHKTSPQTVHIAATGVSLECLLEYHSHFCVHDVWFNACVAIDGFQVGATYCGSQLVPREAFLRSYFWTDFLSRYDIADIVTTVLEVPGPRSPAHILTLHRRADQPPFGPEEARRLAALSPHLRRALRMHKRMAPALALGTSLLDMYRDLDAPVLFIAGDASLPDFNAAAARLLEQSGSPLRQIGGALHWHGVDGWRPMMGLLDVLARGEQPSLQFQLVSDQGQGALLTLRRVHGAFTEHLTSSPAVAVASIGRLDAASAGRLLARRYALTPTELRIAVLLACKHRPSDAASVLGISLSTVRSHVRSLYQKTGVQRQAQLVTLFASCADWGSDMTRLTAQ